MHQIKFLLRSTSTAGCKFIETEVWIIFQIYELSLLVRITTPYHFSNSLLLYIQYFFHYRQKEVSIMSPQQSFFDFQM